MSTLQVANIQFETTGTNRIDFPAGGNTIFFRAENVNLGTNVAVTGTYAVNTEQLIVGTLGAANTTILGANIVTGNVTVTNDILKSGLPYLIQRANVVVFTASGTYTPISNVQYVLVIATGAGGTGGGSDTDGAAGGGGTGGGAGGTAIGVYSLSQASGATVTIGVRGAAGAATGTSGTTGGNTTFTVISGTSLTANGGSAGIGSGLVTVNQSLAGVDGGAASGGDINLTGGSSGAAGGTDVGGIGIGGSGGASFWGGGGFGGIGGVGDRAGGAAGLTTYGAGGGGGGSGDSATGAIGGFSANGVVFILEFTA